MIKLHVTGMFRSGTTLLCKMLDAHKNIVCANDPYLPIFKSFRNSIEASCNPCASLSPNRPLDDYYFDTYTNQLMSKIQNSGLNMDISQDELEKLRNDIRTYTSDFSPDIAVNINRLNGSTYDEILSSAFDLVEHTDKNKKLKVTAFKSAWTNEFTKHILNSEINSKIIVITRDARAVAASKNALPDKYPWLFLARQWRKQAAFAWIAQNTPAWKDRILCLRYEEMVASPHQFAIKACEFLNIDYDENMLNAAGFKDPQGRPWSANSSHFENVQSFNTNGIDKWKKALREDEIEFIEYLCAPELVAFDYDLTNSLQYRIPDRLLTTPPRVPTKSLANWVKPYELSTKEEITATMNKESDRYNMLYTHNPPDDNALKMAFLIPEFYKNIRQTKYFYRQGSTCV